MDRTLTPVQDICELTELCLKSTYFQYQDQFYEQIDGAAMGSSLSTIIANIYMEHFEKKTLSSAPLKPKVWRRYMDDTFVLWSHSRETLEAFLNHLNSQHKVIQFTMEEEVDGQIAFRREGNKLTTSVYHKKTHTD